MLLAVDIGNSCIKVGVFDGEVLASKLSVPTIPTATSAALAKVLHDKLPSGITVAIVSSVVPELDAAMRGFIIERFRLDPRWVTNDLDFGFAIDYRPLSDAGSDRLVKTFAAVEKYGEPCIACSFGTALAIDIVTADRRLVGGLIAPGMQTLSKALDITTSRLPEVEIARPDRVIQNTTVGSIQSGITYGYFGLVEGLLKRIKAEIGDDSRVIATGGFASMVAQNCGCIDVVDEELMLEGLRMLADRIL